MNFLKQTLANPKRTGAVAPSSKQLADLIVKSAEFSAGDTIVELGPGTGAFTKNILGSMPDDSDYFGIEINKKFSEYLQESYPNAVIHHGPARDIQQVLKAAGHDSCDCIISGLPWAAFRPGRQTSLLKLLHETLSEDGRFLTFAYTPFHHLPRGKTFRSALESRFSKVTKTSVVPNLPPAFVYVCRK